MVGEQGKVYAPVSSVPFHIPSQDSEYSPKHGPEVTLADRLVVRTTRRGRANPGSIPG